MCGNEKFKYLAIKKSDWSSCDPLPGVKLQKSVSDDGARGFKRFLIMYYFFIRIFRF